MIDKEKIEDYLRPILESDGYFLVEVDVKPVNRISALIDSREGVSIDYCTNVSRLLVQFLDRDLEDFDLEVSSPGVGKPFKVKAQYHKSVDRPLEVMLLSGLMVKGILRAVDDQFITLAEEKMVRREGKKSKKELQISIHRFSFEEIKSVKELISL